MPSVLCDVARMIPVGTRIQQLRQRRNLTREGLADELGIHRQTVWRWETGQTQVEANDVPRIAKALGVTVNALYRDR